MCFLFTQLIYTVTYSARAIVCVLQCVCVCLFFFFCALPTTTFINKTVIAINKFQLIFVSRHFWIWMKVFRIESFHLWHICRHFYTAPTAQIFRILFHISISFVANGWIVFFPSFLCATEGGTRILQRPKKKNEEEIKWQTCIQMSSTEYTRMILHDRKSSLHCNSQHFLAPHKNRCRSWCIQLNAVSVCGCLKPGISIGLLFNQTSANNLKSTDVLGKWQQYNVERKKIPHFAKAFSRKQLRRHFIYIYPTVWWVSVIVWLTWTTKDITLVSLNI